MSTTGRLFPPVDFQLLSSCVVLVHSFPPDLLIWYLHLAIGIFLILVPSFGSPSVALVVHRLPILHITRTPRPAPPFSHIWSKRIFHLSLLLHTRGLFRIAKSYYHPSYSYGSLGGPKFSFEVFSKSALQVLIGFIFCFFVTKIPVFHC